MANSQTPLNKEVRKLNLIVPLSWQQQSPFSPERELERALTEFEALASEKRAAALERARRQATARRLRQLRQPAQGLAPFAFGATWTLTPSEPMPSMFAALKEVLHALLNTSRAAGRRSL